MRAQREWYALCSECPAQILVVGPDKDVDKALRRVDWTTGPTRCRKCSRRAL